jgi:hypothetical protein
MTLTYGGIDPSNVVGVNYDAARTFNAGTVGTFANYAAGVVNWTQEGGTSVATFATQLQSTMALSESVSFDVVDFESLPSNLWSAAGMGSTRATLVRDLYARNYWSVMDSNTRAQVAAFQVALWEITHENLGDGDAGVAATQLDLARGAHQARSSGSGAGAVLAARNMLAGLGGDDGLTFLSFAGFELMGLASDTAQNQVAVAVVPLPGAAPLAALGLLALRTLRRRATRRSL